MINAQACISLINAYCLNIYIYINKMHTNFADRPAVNDYKINASLTQIQDTYEANTYNIKFTTNTYYNYIWIQMLLDTI